PDVGALKKEPAARWPEETREHPASGRLSTPALTDEADRLALAERERDVVHRFDRPGRRGVSARDAVELDERSAHASFSATGASASDPSAAATASQRMHAASCSGVSTRSSGGACWRASFTGEGQGGEVEEAGGWRRGAGGGRG